MKIVESSPGKRPIDATRNRGLELRAAGLTFREIALLWNVTPQRVYQILYPEKNKKKAEAHAP